MIAAVTAVGFAVTAMAALGSMAPSTSGGATSSVAPQVSPPSVVPSASPSVAPAVAIPPEALLQPEDVGPGLVIERVNVLEDGTGYYANAMAVKSVLLPVQAMCPAYQALNLPPRSSRYYREHTVQRPATTRGRPEQIDPEVQESVVRLTDEATAAKVLDDVRLVVTTCARYVSAGPITQGGVVAQAEATHEWSALDADFIGAGSLIVRHSISVRRAGSGEMVERSAYLSGYVRVGDLVAVLTQLDDDPQRARDLTVRAAQRLCAATPRC
ncbi:hypothetical protein D7I43_30995 [Micromonospora globbae]|uniref:PknH-like extracellular domain-containing protein n=1 Tax=Micromonospora globbae TaxID=1894969 RepID=A0A420EQA2_9ACTN|nr:hypothetical protein D7I43_30995 [Micromonospora globbae]